MPRAKPPPPPSTPDEIEQQFYEALQRADIEALMAVWSDDDEIVCVHPGGPRAVGAAAIRAAFEAIFANGAIAARAEKVRRLQAMNCAVHSVLERIEIPTDEGPQTAWVVATNVYVKSGAGWAMAAHHASPGSPREVQDIAEAASTLH
ncbi:nuclear transport factor 2 family protein [uncultured Piscinibacter sp.]|uniref:YybH family protein n=1 Tax=uncultured Piscinibacter sp. TaxID=1131835 RepID=UPI002621B0C1|nr:nuclear transport factor 2 family protein [uncultured Piscinibacter sp.]